MASEWSTKCAEEICKLLASKDLSDPVDASTFAGMIDTHSVGLFIEHVSKIRELEQDAATDSETIKMLRKALDEARHELMELATTPAKYVRT